MFSLGQMKPSLLTSNSSHITGELLHFIFTFLIDSPKDLHSCSLVSREWNNFANRLLWRTPVFHSKSSLISFMNTVVVNNYVARYVRELDLERYKGNLLSLHFVERLIKFLPRLENLSMLSFDNHMQRRPDNSFLTSLFFTFPNLRRLTLTATTCSHDLFTDIAYLMRQCTQLEELKLLMNFNPTSHICQKPIFTENTLIKFQDIGPLQRLKHLEIAGPFVDGFLKQIFLPHTPNLTKLTIAGGVFTSQYIHKISTFCPHLQSLNLIRFEDPCRIFPQVCVDIAHHFHDRLTELTISLINPREISPVLWKSLNKSTTSISLHNTKMTNVFIKALAEHIGPNLHTLRLRNITHNQRPGIRAWTAVLSKCAVGLRILDVSMNMINDRIGQLIARYCHSLSGLSIAKTKMTEASIESIICSNRNHLKSLNLNGVYLNKSIIRAISTYGKRLRNLHLQVSGALVSNPDLDSLFRSIGGQLQYLDLRGRTLDTKMCQEIAKNCEHLRSLNFCNHPKLHDEHILILLHLRPNLQITNLHCSKCFFVKGGLSTDLIERIHERGIFVDTWWHQQSNQDCYSPYHQLAGMLD